MAYQPTLADIDEIHKTAGSAAGFQPTLQDLPQGSPHEKSFVDNLKNALLGIVHMPSALYHTGEGAAEELATDPIQASKNLIEGARATGQNRVLPFAKEMVQAVAPGLGLPWVSRALEDVNVPTYQPEQPMADTTKVGELAASLAPIAKMGSLTEQLVRGASEAIPEFFGKKLATAIGSGAAAGATTAPLAGVPVGLGALTGALTPAGLQPGSTLLRKGISGTVTPAEFAARRATIPAGIKAPIGELAKSPAMSKLYGLSSAMFGSGAGKPFNQLNEVLKSQQKEILGNTAVPIQDANAHVYDSMKSAYEGSKLRTDAAYKAYGETADTKDLNFNRTALDDVLNKQAKKLSGKIRSKSSAALYQPTVDIIQDYKDTDLPTFLSATDERVVLNDKLSAAVQSGDKPLTRQLTLIKNALDKSLADSAKPDPELQNLHNAAKNARIEQGKFEKIDEKTKSPFYKIYEKNGDPGSFISQYLKPSAGTKDQSALLDHLSDRIPDSAKKVMANSYLDSDTTAQFMNKLGKLNSKQRETLFGNTAAQAEHLLDLQKIYPKMTSPEFVPQTGLTGGTGTQLGAGVMGSALSLMHGDPTQAAVMFGAIPAAGQTIQRGLRSDLLKDAYQKALQRGNIDPNLTLMNILRGTAMQGGQQ